MPTQKFPNEINKINWNPIECILYLNFILLYQNTLAIYTNLLHTLRSTQWSKETTLTMLQD